MFNQKAVQGIPALLAALFTALFPAHGLISRSGGRFWSLSGLLLQQTALLSIQQISCLFQHTACNACKGVIHTFTNLFGWFENHSLPACHGDHLTGHGVRLLPGLRLEELELPKAGDRYRSRLLQALFNNSDQFMNEMGCRTPALPG